jgi:predicted 3-demethylubiquinone-9 3-methyltransferase (glyoxalase superfamily)
MQRIVPNLWFDTQAEDAAKFYTSIFPDSRINNVMHYGESGPREEGLVLTVDFEIKGLPFTAINGGPEFKFDEAISFLVECENQEEVDEYWDRLLEGGTESQCGWLKDKYGLSWQIIPKQLGELLTSGTTEQRNRTMEAMLKMVKIDIKVLEDAHRSE